MSRLRPRLLVLTITSLSVFWAWLFILPTFLSPISDLDLASSREQIASSSIPITPALNEIIGKHFMIGHWANTPVASTTELIKKYRIGGVVIMSAPDSPAEIKDWVKEWQGVSSSTLLIAIDQEGGPVTRLKSDDFIQTGQREITSPEMAYQIGYTRGQKLSALGITYNFSPVLDTATTVGAFMYDRVFPNHDDSPELAKAMIAGLADAGVTAVIKHFPGHANTAEDSHTVLPIVEVDRLELDDFVSPFIQTITDPKVKALMTAHVLFPKIDAKPATLSHFFLTDYLRDIIGFKGIIITDDMSMDAIDTTWTSEQAAVLSLAAVADIVLFAAEPPKVVAALDSLQTAIKTGKISTEQLRQSSERLNYLSVASEI